MLCRSATVRAFSSAERKTRQNIHSMWTTVEVAWSADPMSLGER